MTATRRALTAIGILAAAAVGATALAGSAQAAIDPNALHVTYDANGSSTVARTNSTINLGPTKLSSYINPDGTVTASLPLPPATTSFKALGLLPVSATVNFIQVGDVTGTLGGVPLQVKTTAKYTLRLSNVVIAGIPTNVGPACQTITPAVIPVASSSTTNFDIVNGGTLTGKYTIPLFAGCGLNDVLIDALVPGPNNPITITLSNGVFG